MIGNLDEKADWNATALLMHNGLEPRVVYDDAGAFLVGYALGFHSGYRDGQADASRGVKDSGAAILLEAAAAGMIW